MNYSSQIRLILSTALTDLNKLEAETPIPQRIEYADSFALLSGIRLVLQRFIAKLP